MKNLLHRTPETITVPVSGSVFVYRQPTPTSAIEAYETINQLWKQNEAIPLERAEKIAILASCHVSPSFDPFGVVSIYTGYSDSVLSSLYAAYEKAFGSIDKELAERVKKVGALVMTGDASKEKIGRIMRGEAVALPAKAKAFLDAPSQIDIQTRHGRITMLCPNAERLQRALTLSAQLGETHPHLTITDRINAAKFASCQKVAAGFPPPVNWYANLVSDDPEAWRTIGSRFTRSFGAVESAIVAIVRDSATKERKPL